MSRFIDANRALWDEWTDVNAASAMYDMAGFLAGRVSLYPTEVEEVGDVTGKRLLHLQCHFGQDTLSWARLGATVTGVDFSPRAIERARALAEETGIDATFIQADVSALEGSALAGEFDVIYTGGGAIFWLPDLKPWARAIGRHLAPGGMFYLREFHPFAYVFADDPSETVPGRVGYPYFPTAEPIVSPVVGSYADPDAIVEATEAFSWPHSFQAIFEALIDHAGLHIVHVREYPYVHEKLFPWVEQRDDGLYYSRDADIPLMFSIKAINASS